MPNAEICIPATANMAWVCALRSRLTPPASARGTRPNSMPWLAVPMATKPELQAVSMAMQGPVKPQRYDILPAPPCSPVSALFMDLVSRAEVKCDMQGMKRPVMQLAAAHVLAGLSYCSNGILTLCGLRRHLRHHQTVPGWL